MKVIFAIKTLKKSKGGSERVFLDICSNLVNRDYDISILSFDEQSGNCLYELDSKIKTAWLGVGDAGRKSSLVETYKRIVALRKYIKQEKPDLVIAFQHSMFIPMAISLIGVNIPLISSEHTVPQYYTDKRIEYLLLILAGLLSNRVTVLSEKIKNIYPSILRNRMVAISNPVSILNAEKVRNYGSSDEGIILNIGRLEIEKDQQSLIKAFALLANKYPGWKLRIVGEGTLKNELKTLVDNMGFGGRISFQGTIDNIEKEYLGANIFVMSSRYESFGLCTAEAIAHGLPVVGFADCPGTNELIADQENGFLVKGLNRELVLSNAIEKLIISPELRKSMGNGGESMIARFSLDKIVDEWEQLIHEVAVQ